MPQKTLCCLPDPCPMTPSPSAALAALRRPRLLMRATACGLPDYRRSAAAKRLGLQALSAAKSIEKLFALEAESEAARRLRSPNYRPARHLEILIALCAEIALLAPPPTCAAESPAICAFP